MRSNCLYCKIICFQGLPTPEQEFAEYTFKKEIRLDNANPGADKTTKEIAKWISALMNTSGGLVLLYSNRPERDRQRDYWLMGFESVLNNWVPESLLQSLVRYRYQETDGQLRIYIFVSKSPCLVTFNFNAFGRCATGVRPIKDLHRVQEMLKEAASQYRTSGTECSSQMNELLKDCHHFNINEPIPATYRESETMEFKHCYCGTSETSELPCFKATKLTQKLGEYLGYLSAFANTHGGSLVLGVEEKRKSPVVRGFPVTENQETEEKSITEYLEKRLGKCIWHGDPGYKPVMGQDWNVFYHKVLEEDRMERSMIEVRITKHSGGMFIQSPFYYVVDMDGVIVEKKVYSEWKEHLQTDSVDAGNKDTQEHLLKHVERACTDINVQAVQSNSISNVSDEKLQLDTSTTTAESKLPKSFKDSQSKHKSDIIIHGLNMHDCCTNRMMRHIQTCKGDKIWYPSLEHTMIRLPNNACSENLMTFLQTRQWYGVASVIEITKEPNTTVCDPLTAGGHSLICHVIIIEEHKPPTIMCCICEKLGCKTTMQALEKLVSYALDSARALKRQFLSSTANKQHQSCLFHFDVEVLLVPNEGDVKTVWYSSENQPVMYPNTNKEGHYTIACNGLAEELLRTRSLLRDRYGQILMDHLTEAQAKVLFAKPERVLVVNGKSGTGKTVIALHLMLKAKKEGLMEKDVIYICSHESLKAFVSSQVQCQVILVKRTNSLTSCQMKMLENAKLIVVDDLHAIELDEHWEENRDDLYATLFTHAGRPNTRVALFFDADQDYMKHLPVKFDKRLRDLAEKVPGILSEDIKIVTLAERIRTSQEINRFMQANQNQANISGIIECLNERPGDDVLYEYIGSIPEEHGKILNAKLNVLEEKYGSRAVVILCDDTDQLTEIKTLLAESFSKTFQKPSEYPIQHTVMCSLEEFGGLEAEVILFLLPGNFGTGKIQVSWKYVNVISSRARERLEFLLPWDPAGDRRESQEQHEKLTDLLELFTMVGQNKLLYKNC